MPRGGAEEMASSSAEPGEAPSLQEVMDDLALRFVVNCPEEERCSSERLLFQVEAAFWFYDDNYREIWPNVFPTYNLLTFAEQMFRTCSLLKGFERHAKDLYESFTEYKHQIPTCGAMLLTPDRLKVRGARPPKRADRRAAPRFNALVRPDAVHACACRSSS